MPIALAHPDRLDVDELVNAESPELAPVARLFHAAERQARVGANELVDEAIAGVQPPRGDFAAALDVFREDGRSEPVNALVRELDRALLVRRFDDRGDG